jgi:hypothetical protein
MYQTQHHNVRIATLVIGFALVIMLASASLAAFIAEGASTKSAQFITCNGHQQPAYINGWSYNCTTPVSPATFVDGDVTTRGGSLQPHTSAWYMCAPNEHRTSYDVIALDPNTLTERSNAGHITTFRTANDAYSQDTTNNLATVVVTSQTDHRPAILAANISNRTVELEVICKHN